MRKNRYGYQLHIQLCATKPAVWRRLLVTDCTTLAQLHKIIQAAVGWKNKQLYMFEIAGQRYGTPDPDWPDDPTMDARRYTIGQLLRHHALSIRYLYDFGDEWLHRIKIEDRIPLDESSPALPLCLAGRNACPPEDCGGSLGFTELLQALQDHTHPGHANALRISGPGFDPKHFALHTVQQRLQNLAPEKSKQSPFKNSQLLMAA